MLSDKGYSRNDGESFFGQDLAKPRGRNSPVLVIDNGYEYGYSSTFTNERISSFIARRMTKFG